MGSWRRRSAWSGIALFVVLVGSARDATDAHAQTGSISVEPDPLDFGEVRVDSSATATLTVTNNGAEPVTIDDVQLDSSSFSIDEDECQGKTLGPAPTEPAAPPTTAPDQTTAAALEPSCEIRVAFSPEDVGQVGAAVEIQTTEGSSLGTVTGEGIPQSNTTVTTPTTTSSTPVTPTTQPTSSSPETTPVATTATTVSPSDAERLKACEDAASAGVNVAFPPRLTMTVGTPTQFVVVASLTGTPSPTTAAGSPPTTSETVPLRCEVQAQVRGVDFTIDPPGFQPGSFLDRPSITWSWDVKALKAGTGTLTLEIRSVAIVEGRRIEGAGGQLYTSAITIDAQPETLWDKVTRWSSDVTDFPLVRSFGSLLVIAGTAAAVWRWLLKRPWPWKRPSPPTPPPAATPSAGTDTPAPPDDAAPPNA